MSGKEKNSILFIHPLISFTSWKLKGRKSILGSCVYYFFVPLPPVRLENKCYCVSLLDELFSAMENSF